MQETLDTLRRNPSHWHTKFVSTPERQATGPNREFATVIDNGIAVKRRAP